MKRLILGKPFFTIEGQLSHFPHPSERINLQHSQLRKSVPLHEALREFASEDDCFECSRGSDLPDEIQLRTPGELHPTVLQLTRESAESYTIRESFDIVLADAPFQFSAPSSTIVIEYGWCSDSDVGLRIVTPGLAKQKFGSSPEAFTAGEILGASSEMPLLYLLGGGAGVLLTGKERGEFLNDPEFQTPYRAFAKIANEISEDFLQNSLQGIDTINRWRAYRTSPKT
ncbi:MAG: hypothetical protein OEM52_07050 [bacterium]|nr:hypothetical protein [bacterium]